MIRLEGVTREYGQGDACVRALVDIDTTISRGEFVSLMGPSGSGKSTLLHLIGGIDAPSRGEITVDGHRLSAMTDDELQVA